jgi:hypothetical protein
MSCYFLASQRCAARNRYDAASDWVGFCVFTIKRRRESAHHFGRGRASQLAPGLHPTPLFVTITAGKLMSRVGAVDQRWRNHPRESAFVSIFLPYGEHIFPLTRIVPGRALCNHPLRERLSLFPKLVGCTTSMNVAPLEV